MKVFKPIIIFTTIYMIAFLSFSCSQAPAYDPDRSQYTKQDKRYHANPDASTYIFPEGEELMAEIVPADAVIIGQIIDDGTTELKYPPYSGEGEGPSYYNTYYQVTVKEVWFGETEETEITLALYGDEKYGTTKPHKGDILVLFLRKSSDYYVLINHENSMFVINPPDDTLMALSYREDLSAFDGKSPSALKKAISQTLTDFSKMDKWMFNNVNDIALSVLKEDHPIYIETMELRAKKAEQEKTAQEQSSPD